MEAFKVPAGLRSLVSRRKTLFAVAAACALALALSAYVTYAFLLKEVTSIRPSLPNAHAALPAQQPAAPVLPPPPSSPPVATAPEPKKAESAQATRFVEKDPFKVEFYSKFQKSRAAQQIAPARAIQAFPPETIVTAAARPVIFQDAPDKTAEEMKKALSSPSTPPPAPALRVLGTYTIRGATIALTDKGELRVDMKVEGFRVKSIDSNGLTLEGVEKKYLIHGKGSS